MLAEQLAGNLIQGVVLGCVYGAATMGLSLIFGVLRIVNVGHGAFIMVGAYTALTLFNSLGVNPILAIPVALLIGLGLGFLFYYLVIQRLIRAPELASLLATFAIGLLLEETVKQVFGSEFRGYNWPVGKVDLWVTVLPMTKVYACAASVLIAVLLYVWHRKTRAGMAMRSVVEDREGARVCGVDVNRVYATSFAVGIALTVASGVLIALFIPVGINPYMGGAFTLKAFVIAVLGGLSSPYGAFFAGVLFGVIENGSYTLLATLDGVEPFGLTRALSFVMLLVILLIRPTGLFGTK